MRICLQARVEFVSWVGAKALVEAFAADQSQFQLRNEQVSLHAHRKPYFFAPQLLKQDSVGTRRFFLIFNYVVFRQILKSVGIFYVFLQLSNLRLFCPFLRFH